MGPRITIEKTDGSKLFNQRVRSFSRAAVYVGIPSGSSRTRKETLQALSKGKATSRQTNKAEQNVTNAELLFIFSKGSPIRGIPARPVLEPAIAAPENREQIDAELFKALSGFLGGYKDEALRHLARAGMAGRNAARKFFRDPRNNWPPNAPSTIRAKGSDVAGINTGSMRNAIDYFVDEG